MKRYLVLFLVIALFALQACSGVAGTESSTENSGLNSPISTNVPYDPSLAGAAGLAPKGGVMPSLCEGAQDANTASFAAEVINLVNVERTNRGLVPLTSQAQLTQAAQKHSIDMGCHFFLSHTGSDGSSPFDRIFQFGYVYSWAGENVAAGFPTPSAVMTGWMNSQGHRDNILNPNYTEIGIGYIFSSLDTTNHYYHYWTMTLGRPQ